MTSEYHEENLSEKAKALHRALKSLQEELEAVDWYQQREDVSQNEELNEILNHNKKEETEHAAMLLEWLRRNDPAFEEHLKTYLFTNLPIVEVEEAAESGKGDAAAERQNNSLGIGSEKNKA
jgi:ferritin-like protein